MENSVLDNSFFRALHLRRNYSVANRLKEIHGQSKMNSLFHVESACTLAQYQFRGLKMLDKGLL